MWLGVSRRWLSAVLIGPVLGLGAGQVSALGSGHVLVQGNDEAPRKEQRDVPATPRDPGVGAPRDAERGEKREGELAPRKDRDTSVLPRGPAHEVTPQRKVGKSAKRTLDHLKRGIPGIE